ncbi:MAG: hypothetical protein ACXADA_18540 [Candidatus Hodarchaeales archaeon]
MHAKADPVVLDMLLSLYRKGHPVALITGRSIGWVEENVFNVINQKLEFPVFMEYGWLWWRKGKLKIERNDFREKMKPFFQELEKTTIELGLVYHSQPCSSTPDNGGMWNEDKKVMISIASNYLVSADQVQSVTKKVLNNLEVPPHREVTHHLGMDLLPEGSTKKKAALKARKLIDSDYIVNEWYIFGDSSSDEEMIDAFDQAENRVEFVNTSEKASENVKRILVKYL